MTNEKRLIDANVFIAELCKDCGNGCDLRDDYCILAGELMKAPTVDAVEVVHGRWENTEHYGFLRCSKCKDVYVEDEWLADGKWSYCPNCGAKMDGDGNG